MAEKLSQIFLTGLKRGRIRVKTPSIPGTLGVGMGAEGLGARLMIRLQFGLKNGISESDFLVYYHD